MANDTLFGEHHIRPIDIKQGNSIGNCWFMAAITSMAEYEGRVENLFLNKEKSASGIYAVQLWALNVPITIIVDDYLPLNS